MKKVLLISPHFDDAVLSAGQFIAGRGGDVDVLTVFSAVPTVHGLFTAYDESCGFNSSENAMLARREEDSQALALLKANPLYLDRLDSQYKEGGDYQNLGADLRDCIKADDYEMVLAPLGLRHPDHKIISDSLLGLDIDNLYLWEDLPHRVTHPEEVHTRLHQLQKGFEYKFIGDGPIQDKVRALWCYKSQMARGDLNPYLLYVPERFWKV